MENLQILLLVLVVAMAVLMNLAAEFESVSSPFGIRKKDHVVDVRDRYPDSDFSVLTELNDKELEILGSLGISLDKFQYEEESCMSRKPQVDYDLLRKGDLLWYVDLGEQLPIYQEVVVTNVYGGVVFLKKTNSEEPEFFLPKESAGFYLGLYPKKILVPDGTEWHCYCPKTEFVYVDMSNKKRRRKKWKSH